MKKKFQATIIRDDSMCCIPVPFDPKPIFGKVRAPVKVTLNGYTFRSTIASMGDGLFIPLRRSNREAAGLEGGETLSVTLELDAEKREVKAPADLVKALGIKSPAWARWCKLSYKQAAGLRCVRSKARSALRWGYKQAAGLRCVRSKARSALRWGYTNQREHVEAIEGAKKPETRARRIEKIVRMMTAD